MALAHDIAPLPEKKEFSQQEKPAEPAPGVFKKLFSPSSHQTEIGLYEETERLRREIGEIHGTVRGWRQGLEIVRERFLCLFADEGIEAIPDLGEVFDPHQHVAVEIEARSDVPENTIVKVLRKGYTHHDRVLRYSEVIVAKVPKDDEGEIGNIV